MTCIRHRPTIDLSRAVRCERSSCEAEIVRHLLISSCSRSRPAVSCVSRSGGIIHWGWRSTTRSTRLSMALNWSSIPPCHFRTAARMLSVRPPEALSAPLSRIYNSARNIRQLAFPELRGCRSTVGKAY
ncbi:MAG: hypothetical protein LBL24_03010 [Bacteroidales bacterium]|nr:hypothetical protein [Bacteroidales bacterium]